MECANVLAEVLGAYYLGIAALFCRILTALKLVSVFDLNLAEWEAYHTLRLDIRKSYHPAAAAEAPQRTASQFKERIIASLKTLEGIELVLLDSNRSKALGWMRFFPQGDVLSVAADFLADRIPRGFIRLIEQGIQSEMSSFRLKKGIAFTDDRRLIQAFSQMTHEQAIPFHQLALELGNVREPILNEWRHRFMSEHPEYSLDAAVSYPSTSIKEYLRLQSILTAELPLGGQSIHSPLISHADMDRFRQVHAQNGLIPFMIFARNPQGEYIGYTETIASKENGTAIQGMTGLLAEHRGVGMAKALKATMIDLLRKEMPSVKRITTTTSPHNEAMLAINKSIGFEVVRNSVQFTFDLTQMRKARQSQIAVQPSPGT